MPRGESSSSPGPVWHELPTRTRAPRGSASSNTASSDAARGARSFPRSGLTSPLPSSTRGTRQISLRPRQESSGHFGVCTMVNTVNGWPRRSVSYDSATNESSAVSSSGTRGSRQPITTTFSRRPVAGHRSRGSKGIWRSKSFAETTRVFSTSTGTTRSPTPSCSMRGHTKTSAATSAPKPFSARSSRVTQSSSWVAGRGSKIPTSEDYSPGAGRHSERAFTRIFTSSRRET